VTLLRGHLLTTGALALIALCYAIAGPSLPAIHQSGDPRLRLSAKMVGRISADCQAVAQSVEESLPSGWGVCIHEPFVIAGDCSTKLLDQHYQQTIAPTARALSIQYFDNTPCWPVTIVLCSSEETYRECNRCLEERERSEYSGVYSRREHRVVVNMATGEGTLAHELTHALAHADFPEMPEWLDEGLASLYEECEFSSDGFRLSGLENWRGDILKGALQRSRIRSISALAEDPFAATERATIDYAQARYFCLFLERHHLLEAFYRKCRQRHHADPDGLASLAEIFNTGDLHEIDARFQNWAKSLK
jgi:hypothetical protein